MYVLSKYCLQVIIPVNFSTAFTNILSFYNIRMRNFMYTNTYIFQ